jgi:hypothetical protein
MKMSQLKMIIREVVREEIRLGLKEVIGEVKKQPVQKPKPKQEQHYSNNPVLNEVLNDTDTTDWEQMGGKKFTSDRMGELIGGSYADMMNNNPEAPVTVDGQQPDFLKKDYRSLMKAVDKKQGR